MAKMKIEDAYNALRDDTHRIRYSGFTVNDIYKYPDNDQFFPGEYRVSTTVGGMVPLAPGTLVDARRLMEDDEKRYVAVTLHDGGPEMRLVGSFLTLQDADNALLAAWDLSASDRVRYEDGDMYPGTEGTEPEDLIARHVERFNNETMVFEIKFS